MRLDALAGHRAQLVAWHESLTDVEDSDLSRDELAAVQVDALVATALRSSEIEGEHLDVASLRSSVVRQLGLEQAGFLKLENKGTKQTDALVR